MHLIERYSLSTGLKIDNPHISSPFFPVAAERYVVFHTSAKDNLRDYDFWPEVKAFLEKTFEKLGLKTVQIGLEKDPSIKCDIDLRGKTTMNQMAYVIKHCDCFIGVDSFPAHLAGAFNKKMLAIYANSYSACVEPYWGDKSNQKIIETHRPNGEKPTFSFNENPKTVNRLKPDEIAKHFCDLICPENSKSIATVHYVGSKYKMEQIEIIPDEPYKIQHPNLFVRMDLLHNEDNLNNILQTSVASVVTRKPIDDQFLNSSRIKNINYVSDEFDEEFVKKILNRGIQMNLICTDKNKLKDQRVKFFDFKILPFDEQEKIENSKKEVEEEVAKNSSIASRKKIIKNQKEYNSLYEANGKKNIDDLFLDLEWKMLYNKSNE